MQYYYEKKNDQQIYLLQQYIYDVNFFRFNWHPEIELLILLRGHIIFCIEGESYDLHENGVILANANRGHAVISEDTDSLAMVIHFPANALSSAQDIRPLEIDCRSTDATVNDLAFRKIRYVASQMMLASISDLPGSKLLLQGGYYTLLGTLLSNFPARIVTDKESGLNIKTYKTIRSIINYMEKNYNNRITLEQLAHMYKYNKTYMSAFFKNNVGISFYDYLTRIRFRHAIQELTSTQKSLTDIAYDCGFADLKTFSLYFKKLFHMSPSKHRLKKQTSISKISSINSRQYIVVGNKEIDEKLQSYLDDKSNSTYDSLLEKNHQLNLKINVLSSEIENFIKHFSELNSKNI